MKGKSSSGVKGVEVMQRSSESKEESHLSGAYIRSLVKHLSSSSRLKDQTLDLKSPNSTLEGRLDEAQPPPPPPPPPPPSPPKKQLRRRLHTRRPYQERLLNMAEARREIVHALKLHRASMKQANDLPSTLTATNPNPNSSRNIDQPNIAYPSSVWSYPTLAPLDNWNLPLPNYQPLGLNLNFQGFNNVDTPFHSGNITNDPPIQPLAPHASSSSSHSYSSLPMCTSVENGDMKMHIAMDEKEMEEIRLIGEKHDIEWNDTVNLVTSAWWSNFLEVDDTMKGNGFPAFDNYCSQDASLPCLDTGEIEWMDDEWWLSSAWPSDI